MADPRTKSAAAQADLEKMAMMKANGATVRTIAEEVGKHHSNVSRALQSVEARAIIERESQRILEALPDITASSLQQISTSAKIHAAIAGIKDENGETITLPGIMTEVDEEGNVKVNLKAALDYLAIAGKRETDILKAVGVLASPVQSMVVQNIYNDNRKATLTPDILKALSGMGQIDDVDEAEIIGGEDD